jgi:hypothetical protein
MADSCEHGGNGQRGEQAAHFCPLLDQFVEGHPVGAERGGVVHFQGRRDLDGIRLRCRDVAKVRMHARVLLLS